MGKMKVMVTGAGGFIGTKVVQELWKRGCEVVYFDVIEPKIEGIKRVNRGTILDQYDLALAARGCDYAIHLAALLGVQKTDSDRLECLYINIQGTLNVIEACIKEGIKKIIFDHDHISSNWTICWLSAFSFYSRRRLSIRFCR